MWTWNAAHTWSPQPQKFQRQRVRDLASWYKYTYMNTRRLTVAWTHKRGLRVTGIRTGRASRLPWRSFSQFNMFHAVCDSDGWLYETGSGVKRNMFYMHKRESNYGRDNIHTTWAHTRAHNTNVVSPTSSSVIPGFSTPLALLKG